jgi:hypothetical protein
MVINDDNKYGTDLDLLDPNSIGIGCSRASDLLDPDPDQRNRCAQEHRTQGPAGPKGLTELMVLQEQLDLLTQGD